MSYSRIALAAPAVFRRHDVRLVPVSRAADLISLVDSSSAQSRFLRFHTGTSCLRPAMAERLAQTPALGLRTMKGELVVDAGYTRTHADEADLAILIRDDYQGLGLGCRCSPCCSSAHSPPTY